MWWWVLGWVVLVLLGGVFLGLVVWGLVRRVIELGREVGRSADRLAPVLTQVGETYVPARSVLSDQDGAPPPRRRTRRRNQAVALRRRPRGVG
jgi:hypothetical protein